MEISVFEKDNRLCYKLYNYDVNLEKTFTSHGYIKTDDAYIKSFPLEFPNRENIINNFFRNAEAMFYEEAGMKSMRWQEGFEHFASVADKSGLDWWTTGKILLPLNGINTEIDDVDFYFRSSDITKVCEAFSDYIIEPVVRDTWRSKAFEYYGLAYSECTICLLVEPLAVLDVPEPVHFGQYASKNLMTYNWNGITVKAPPIELYIKTLKRWGKTEFAEAIENALHTVS